MIYLIYFLSIILIITPLVYILATQQFRTYFVYFTSAGSFLVINLLGSISPNITQKYNSLGYYLVFLLTAMSFHILFWILRSLSRSCTNQSLACRLGPSFNKYNSKYTRYIFGSIIFSLFFMCMFSLTVSPPFFLRMSLLQGTNQSSTIMRTEKISTNLNAKTSSNINAEMSSEKTSASSNIKAPQNINADTGPFTQMRLGPPADSSLIKERMHIVSTRAFHWFALVVFELPLFLLTFVLTAYLTIKYNEGLTKQYINWRKLLVVVTAFAVISSLWILSKEYLIYLIFTMYLVYLVFKNKVEVKKLVFLLLFSLVVLAMLYAVYCRNLELNYPVLLVATLFHRIMEVYPWAGAVVYNIFPEQIPFLHGASMINLFHIFHTEPFNIGKLTYIKIYGMTGGSAPVPAIFESYANWGWTGAVITQVIIMLSILAISFLSWSEDIWVFSLACYLTIKIVKFWQAPLWYAMFEPTLIFFVMMMFGYYLCFLSNSRIRISHNLSQQRP